MQDSALSFVCCKSARVFSSLEEESAALDGVHRRGGGRTGNGPGRGGKAEQGLENSAHPGQACTEGVLSLLPGQTVPHRHERRQLRSPVWDPPTSWGTSSRR